MEAVGLDIVGLLWGELAHWSFGANRRRECTHTSSMWYVCLEQILLCAVVYKTKQRNKAVFARRSHQMQLNKAPVPLTLFIWLPGQVALLLSQAMYGLDCSGLLFFFKLKIPQFNFTSRLKLVAQTRARQNHLPISCSDMDSWTKEELILISEQSLHKLGGCDSLRMLIWSHAVCSLQGCFLWACTEGMEGYKESKTKQVSLFEKRMFIEIGFNLGAILGEELLWYLGITLTWAWCCVSSLRCVRQLWMCSVLLQPRSDAGHGCVCMCRLSIAVYIKSICKLPCSASITPMIWNIAKLKKKTHFLMVLTVQGCNGYS